MKKEARRRSETVRFLKWIRKYSGWWYLICTPDEEHMNMQMMKLLIQKLEEEKFYEIIFVLCMVHRNAKFMKDLPEYVLQDMMTKSWETDAEDIIQEIVSYLD